MKNILEDICGKLKARTYVNEEQIRFSLVGRILAELGWNIWDPKEVYTEFHVARLEDNTKVDIALFLRPHLPSVYIEIKAHEKIAQFLPAIEKQLRDYNRNNTATFTIITDGQNWRFYYSQTQGEFSDKCYHKIDMLNDDFNQLEERFISLLSKEKIENGEAKSKAEKYLEFSQKERAIRDCIPKANKLIELDPLLNKVQAIQNCLVELRYQVSQDEILDFLKKNSTIESANIANAPQSSPKDTPPIRTEASLYSNNHDSNYTSQRTQERDKISVTFPDNIRIPDGKPTAVFVATIVKIGVEKIKQLNIVRSIDLISTAKHKTYAQHKVGNYWVMTNLSTNDKYKVLNEINQRLDLRLRIEKF